LYSASRTATPPRRRGTASPQRGARVKDKDAVGVALACQVMCPSGRILVREFFMGELVHRPSLIWSAA